MNTYCNGSTMSLNNPIQMVLASRSKFFLEGIRRILEDEADIKIVAESLNHEEIKKYLTTIKPEFMLLDNTTLELDVEVLLGLMNERSPSTKVIILSSRRNNKTTTSNVIYVSKNKLIKCN